MGGAQDPCLQVREAPTERAGAGESRPWARAQHGWMLSESLLLLTLASAQRNKSQVLRKTQGCLSKESPSGWVRSRSRAWAQLVGLDLSHAHGPRPGAGFSEGRTQLN